MIYDKQDIKRYLKERTGYVKKGTSALRQILTERGVTVSHQDCSEALSEVRKELKDQSLTPEKDSRILIYDIETSYNIVKAWSCGWNKTIKYADVLQEKKIICISYKWYGEDETYTLAWDSNQNDKFLLEQFIPVLNEADMIVAHNGDRYDLKFIKTRAVIHGLPMMINYKQFDTLKVAKKKFNFPQNTLNTIASVLGLELKNSTNMALWDSVILSQDPDALQEMIDYCEQDVKVLEQVFEKLMYWESPKFHLGALQGKEKYTSPITGGLNLEYVKTVSTTYGTLKYIMKDLDTGRNFEMSATNYRKFKEQENGIHN